MLSTKHGFSVVDPKRLRGADGGAAQRSRAATRFEGDAERIQTYAELGLQPTEFVGYETTRAFASVVSILLDGNTIVRELTPQIAANHRVEIVLDQTPFYAEGGGQVGDRGEIGLAGTATYSSSKTRRPSATAASLPTSGASKPAR